MSRKKSRNKAARAKLVDNIAAHRSSSSAQTFPQSPQHSLVDEARWMSKHRTSAYEAGKQLRKMPIQFVSAGKLEGTIKDELASPTHPGPHDSTPPNALSLSPITDGRQAMAQMSIRSPSPTPSEASSSTDEVIFKGRSGPPTDRGSVSTGKLPMSAYDRPPQCIKHLGTSGPASDRAHKPESTSDSDADSISQNLVLARSKGRPFWEGKTTAWEHRSKPGIGWLPCTESSRDAALNDYMQNTQDYDFAIAQQDVAGFANREMDLDAGSHNDWETASEIPEHDESGVRGNSSWDSDMLQDFDHMSTSSEALGPVVRILSKRIRPNGLQYLCVHQGAIVDDARWLPAKLITQDSELELLRTFEENLTLLKLASTSSSDDNEAEEQHEGEGDDNINDDDDDGDEDSEVDSDLDDETIARVLQKQEELGLGSDEILLYGDDEFFSAYSDDKPYFGVYGVSRKKPGRRGRSNREPLFSSATAMADVLAMDPYGGFDIMDIERPSLKQKKKGRRGLLPPEIDDADLNQQLQNAWEADRVKKRLRKVEREELRQQGLLGRKTKQPNLKVKYKGGIDMEDVVEELREFLLGESANLSLPPMEADRRATIHQIAALFNLSSRSRGDGPNRFTVLAKTSRTQILTDDEFDRTVNSKTFKQRLRGSLQGARNSGLRKNAMFQSKKRTRPQVGYQDGETVGANAPELGPENKGHALMMKMGWSKGMALGTIHNQGILHPILHTVKINKAGLR